MSRKHPGAVALGSIRSKRKAAAARANGRKGGRPTLDTQLAHWRAVMAASSPSLRAFRQAADQVRDLECRLARKANAVAKIIPHQPSVPMNPMTPTQHALEQDILRLIEDARYAMTNPDGMTDSDLQGCAMAIALRYVK